jgi:hypothetical protein
VSSDYYGHIAGELADASESPCSRECGYCSSGKDLADHERYEHADCPRCGAKAPAEDLDGFAYSVTHRLGCPRLAPGHRYEDEEGVMSEAGGGLTYPDSAGDETCDSCTCCTVAGCVPSQCGEDDYGRFHCPCTSE